ncbi:MAG: Gfo/Idh/MocA family oxidoreductase [Chloroflexi bacterium]|nr:Gfo/Idh/MocA family oxidoreductase [Chloroflexota bacterium]OJV92817.1 MAG: oxidoreductase [Chloroflexi bacterium 54-19]
MTDKQGTVRFAVIGINHGHIYGQVNLLLRAGAEFVAVYAKEPDLLEAFSKAFPQAQVVADPRQILEDPSIQLVVSAGIANERAPLGIKAMQHGKDYMSDKPGFTSLAQLAEARKVQKETGRIYSICYSEHFENQSTVKAGELVAQGRIGKVVQTLGLGPHRTNLPTRPAWFFVKEQYGGILTDIGSHQCEQFLFFTGSTEAEVVSSSVGNYKHPQYPELEDFGQVTLHGNGGNGYVRVDWYTPDGLSTWGDGRLTILGTEGYIELRKYVDIAGKPGGNHLFVVDQKGTEYIDCNEVFLPYGSQLVNDILNRTETAMTQAHCFLASELALKAEAQAIRLG